MTFLLGMVWGVMLTLALVGCIAMIMTRKPPKPAVKPPDASLKPVPSELFFGAQAVLRSLSTPVFFRDAEIFREEGGEAAVAELLGTLRTGDSSKIQEQLLTADPNCLASLLLRLIDEMGAPMCPRPVADAATNLIEVRQEQALKMGVMEEAAKELQAAAEAEANQSDDADVSAAKDEAAAAQVAAAEEAMAAETAADSQRLKLKEQIGLLPTSRMRLLARVLRYLYRLSQASSNDYTAEELAAKFSPLVLGVDPAALEALILDWPALRSAFQAPSKAVFQYQKAATVDTRAAVGIPFELNEKIPKNVGVSESVGWTNAFACRWFSEYGTAPHVLKMLQVELQDVFTTLDLPSFLGPIVVEAVELGSQAPHCRSITNLKTQDSGELCLSLDVKYVDGIQALLTIPVIVEVGGMSITLPVPVKCKLESMEARARLFLPAPGRDNGFAWLCFEKDPDMDIQVEISATEQEKKSAELVSADADSTAKDSDASGATTAMPHMSMALSQLPAIKQFLIKKLVKEIHELLVLPKWDRIPMPWRQRAKPDDGYLSAEDASLRSLWEEEEKADGA
jgi:hypothetical protein